MARKCKMSAKRSVQIQKTFGGTMRKLLAILALLPALLLAQTDTPKKAAAAPVAAPVVMTPDKIQWGPAPPIFPAGAQAALIAGDLSKPGPFIVRMKMPDGYRIMPHWHPASETVTVLSGQFRVGMGGKFDESTLTALPAHSVAVVPPRHNHYAMAKGETEVQINGMGPFKLTYVNSADDPSKKNTDMRLLK